MSVSADISAAIDTAVTALALTGVTTKKRKVPTLPQGQDPPQAVISVAEEGEIEPLTATKDLVRYPCAVTLVTGGGGKLVDDTTLRTWREQVRVAVNRPSTFASVSGFHQVDPTGRAPFHPAALPKDLNYSILVFTVQVKEARSA